MQLLCVFPFTGICKETICAVKKTLLGSISLFVILLALFFIFAFYHDSNLEQSAYPGDTVLLVKGLKPFWNSRVVVTKDGSVQNEWEVSLFMERCVNLMPYYVQSHKSEPHNLTSDGDPVRILEHRNDLNNYFISGSVSVMLTFFITTRVEMDLCIFDNLKWYQDFYENPTQEAKQNVGSLAHAFYPSFHQQQLFTITPFWILDITLLLLHQLNQCTSACSMPSIYNKKFITIQTTKLWTALLPEAINVTFQSMVY